SSLVKKEMPGPAGPMAGGAAVARARDDEQEKPAPPPSARPADTPVAAKALPVKVPAHRLSPWGEPVDRAIREGVACLKGQQRPAGSWPDVGGEGKTGTTSLVTLALLAAGEKPDSPTIRGALEYLRRFGPEDLNYTYAIGLQTMVYAAAQPERDRER